jgi:hypothetical protein
MSNNKTRGNTWERTVINEYKKRTKYTDATSSRLSSRELDNKGVDIYGLPFNVQIKTLSKKPDLIEILNKMPKGEDNLVIVKRTKKTPKGSFREVGRYVVLDFDYYFKLLNDATNNKRSEIT